MAVTKFGRNYDALCGKVIRAPAVASTGLVDSLKRPVRAVLGLSLHRFSSNLSVCFSRRSSRNAIQVLDFPCRPGAATDQVINIGLCGNPDERAPSRLKGFDADIGTLLGVWLAMAFS